MGAARVLSVMLGMRIKALIVPMAASRGAQPSARCAAIASTTSRPPIPSVRRTGGVMNRPAWPAASVSTRCQPAEAAPAPVANATTEAGPSSVSAAATAAKDAIVSGFAAVIARKRL
jgi:hypothetical protein